MELSVAGSVRSPLSRKLFADINSMNLTAGLTAGIFYAFAATPVMFEATARLGLSSGAAISWYVATFLTSAFSGLYLSIKYKHPIPVGWTLPGLVFLSTAGAGRSHGEITGAVIVAGIAMILLGALGVAERLMRWMPLPVVMGIFAGSVLKYATGVFDHLDAQPVAVGAAVAGYVAARAIGVAWFPPMAGAFGAGLAAVMISGSFETGGFGVGAPTLTLVQPTFNAGAIASLTLPLIVMSVAMGNIQGFGVLISQGYRPPVKLLTSWMGITTIINAAFGGHTSTLQSHGTAMLAGKDAGPHEHRYMSGVIASLIAVLLALFAASAGALLGLFPPGFVPALAGLAILGPLMEAMKKTVVSEFPMGGFFAFVIAASSIDLYGLAPAFWALVGGFAVALLLERPACLALWRPAEASA